MDDIVEGIVLWLFLLDGISSVRLGGIGVVVESKVDPDGRTDGAIH